MDDSFHILVACTGNVCRSPLAEALLRSWATELPEPLRSRIEVTSAGTHAPTSWPASAGSATIAREFGADLSDHQSRQLDVATLRAADLVLVATAVHRSEIVRMLPRAARYTFAIREFDQLAAALPWAGSSTAGAGTAGLPPVRSTPDDLRTLVQTIARRRGLTGADSHDWDIVDPFRREMGIYRQMADELIPPLRRGAEALLGLPSVTTEHYGSWTLQTAVVGSMAHNAYLITDLSTGHELLVDAAAEPGRLLAMTAPSSPLRVLTTHHHRDHWEHGLAAVVAARQAPTLAGADDVDDIGVPTDIALEHRDQVSIGTLMATVIALSGHTSGSIALALDDDHSVTHLFTGDSLFPGGVGKTDSATDFTQLFNGVVSRIFDRYSDDTVVHPGHGAPTTLGEERPHLDEWRQRGW